MSETKIKPSALDIKAWLQSADIIEMAGKPIDGYCVAGDITGNPGHVFAVLYSEGGESTFNEGESVASAEYKHGALHMLDSEGSMVTIKVFKKTELELYIAPDARDALPSEQDTTSVGMQRIERVAKVQQWIHPWLLESMIPAFFIAVGKMEEQEYLDFLDSPVTGERTYTMIEPWLKEIRPDQPEYKIAISLENAVQDGEIEAVDYASLADTYGTMNPHEFLRTLGEIKDANVSQQ